MEYDWLMLIISLPTENATLRQRVWRALKAAGTASLRDGVHLLPKRPACQAIFDDQVSDIQQAGGTALVLAAGEPEGAGFAALFRRQAEWDALRGEIDAAHRALAADVAGAARRARKLRKAFTAVAQTDYFAGPAQAQAAAALAELETAVARAQSPGEPQPAQAAQVDLTALEPAAYRARCWATRARPWVDRLASAWLIRRFIDPAARILWLPSPADCPPDAVGFDFDGAAFSHVGERVTFEVLALRFGFADDPGLARLARLVRHLDVGGAAPPEAAGIEAVLGGLRATCSDDDTLLAQASAVWDALHAQFSAPQTTPAS